MHTTITNPRAIVRQLIRQARDARRNARIYVASADYWHGVSKGQLYAAREVAHLTYGASWLAARDRRRCNFPTTLAA